MFLTSVVDRIHADGQNKVRLTSSAAGDIEPSLEPR